MTTSVLYISYTGLLDPLGQSQVLQYVLGLAREHRMTLLTFEKPEALQDAQRLADLQAQCKAAGVDWHRLNYHNKPNALASFYDLLMGMRAGVRLAKQAKIDVVHCRSYLASLMGLAVKRATGARHVFDMRGFWPDERVDGGIWLKSSLQYKLFKRAERLLFLNTDHVVSLTRAGVREFQQFDYLQNHPVPVSVIPTCTNLALFSAPEPTEAASPSPHFTLGYIGSVGSWYMFDEVVRSVRMLLDARPDARFLVINKGGHEAIRAALEAGGVDMARVEIKAVPYDKVGLEVSRMDAGIFFIKAAWSKRASCPTRMGEFLASGKPCLTNAGVGDVKEDFHETGTGVAITDLSDASLKAALAKLVQLTAEPGMAERCRRAAEDRFSLEGGVKAYAAIYASLAKPGEECGA
jgi:glycosyltransferase involved in cell wall biosynthesis